jgi:hypothetical protein
LWRSLAKAFLVQMDNTVPMARAGRPGRLAKFPKLAVDYARTKLVENNVYEKDNRFSDIGGPQFSSLWTDNAQGR